MKTVTLQKVLTEKSSKIGRGRLGGIGETLTRKLNLTQATDARDGLAKAAYRKIFDFLLLTLNAANAPKPDRKAQTQHQIGILDIFGFERVSEGNIYQTFMYSNITRHIYIITYKLYEEGTIILMN